MISAGRCSIILRKRGS